MLKRKRCAYENCLTRPNCNLPDRNEGVVLWRTQTGKHD